MVRDAGIFIFMWVFSNIVILATRAIERRLGMLLKYFGAPKSLFV